MFKAFCHSRPGYVPKVPANVARSIILKAFFSEFGPGKAQFALPSAGIKSNQITFYCHITTAQVPWWVKFLWACSRQCRKTTDNLHMDRQCKKTTDNLHMDRQCKKTTNNLHMDRTVQKTALGAFTVLQTVQKNNNSNLHMDRQCKKATAIYIWTVHIYRLYRRQSAKYTYIYSVHIVYYKDILNYQRHIIHRMGSSALCTVSIHNVVYA